MRWIKHLSDAHNDEKLAMLRADAGFEGYGFYWFALEVIAKHVDDEIGKTSVTYPVKFWANFAGVSPRILRRLVEVCSNLGLLTAEFSGNSLTLGCDNILKYRDEWSRKRAKNSGVTPERLRSKDIDIDTDTDTDKIQGAQARESDSVSAEPEGEKPEVTANPKPRARFSPPTVEQVQARILEQCYLHTDAEGFVNFYASKGWMVGKNPMKDWGAALAGWEAREKKSASDCPGGQNRFGKRTPEQISADACAGCI